jgi:multisubunit Na+/H+ antiporter MnhB subunit
VLGIAAMGVWMLLRKRNAVAVPPPAPMTSLILRTASRLIIPLVLLLSIFIYFKGHQSPGGGFVAGLVASVGLVIHRMAEGPGAAASLRKFLPCSERVMIAIGLLLALATGSAALLFGLPFFTSNNGFIPLPGDAHGFHWATVMVFDLGVFFVVTGVVLGMINAISDDPTKGGAA